MRLAGPQRIDRPSQARQRKVQRLEIHPGKAVHLVIEERRLR